MTKKIDTCKDESDWRKMAPMWVFTIAAYLVQKIAVCGGKPGGKLCLKNSFSLNVMICIDHPLLLEYMVKGKFTNFN